MTFLHAIDMTKLIKSKNSKCIIGMGGPHAILCAKEIFNQFEHIDFICVNDGERSLAMLMDSISNGEWPCSIQEMLIRNVHNQNNSQLSRNIDDLPMPARDDLLQMSINAPVTEARLSTSRGCIYQCSFCIDAKRYNRKWYARSANQVLDEIESLNKCLGIDHFWISDDNFLLNMPRSIQRAKDIAHGLLERRLQITYRARFRSDTFVREPELLKLLSKSGLTCAYVGLEAGSSEQLERFKKNTTVEQHKKIVNELIENDVALQIGFIMFEPYTCYNDIYESAKFLYEIGEMYVVGNFIQSLDIFPGARIVEKMRQDGLVDLKFGAVSNYDAYQFHDNRIERLAKYLENCHDDETITRDKWIYRYHTNLLPRIYHKAKLNATFDMKPKVKKWKELEKNIIYKLNKINYGFFKKVTELSISEKSYEYFDIEKEKTWLKQINLLEEYSNLYGRISKEFEASFILEKNNKNKKTIKFDQFLPDRQKEYLQEALKYIPGSLSSKIDFINEGNLNYSIKIENETGAYVFRCRRNDYQNLIKDYLYSLYSCAGISDTVKFRSISQEIEFINKLSRYGLPVAPIIAHSNEWILSRYINGKVLSKYLQQDGSVSYVLRFIYQLFIAHKKDIIYGDRWGANEIIDSKGKLHFIDFDIELASSDNKLTEKLKNTEIAIALFGCLLYTSKRENMIKCIKDYGLNLLTNWGYNLKDISNALIGYRSFYLNPNKPTNKLSPSFDTYKKMKIHLNSLIDILSAKETKTKL